MSPARKASGRNLAQEVVRRLIDEDEWKEAVESLWSIATQGTKPDWVWCPNCRRKIQADRVDLRARSDALARLQEMGFGKPRPDEDDGRGMVVHRTIIAPEGVQKTTIGGQVALAPPVSQAIIRQLRGVPSQPMGQGRVGPRVQAPGAPVRARVRALRISEQPFVPGKTRPPRQGVVQVPIAYTPTGDPFFYGQEAFSGPSPSTQPAWAGAPGTGGPGLQVGVGTQAPKGTPAWLQQIVQQALGMGDATARQAREQHILSSGLPAGTLPWVQQMFGQQTPVAQTAARVPATQTNLNWY